MPRALRRLAFEDGSSQLPGEAASQVPVQLPSGATRTWTVIVINNAPPASAPIGLRLHLPLAGARHVVAETAVETSAEHSLDDLQLPGVSTTGQLSASVSPQSITTYVVRPSS